jgi:hypothetical protein
VRLVTVPGESVPALVGAGLLVRADSRNRAAIALAAEGVLERLSLRLGAP